jgi:hypothetical protein
MMKTSTSTTSFKDGLWMHWKSRKLYRIIGFPLREADLIPQVSYRRYDGTGPEFTRTCEEFFDGRFRTYIGDDEEADEPIGLDADKRSIVAGDYVALYNGTAEDRRAWGKKESRKVIEVLDGYVKLEPEDSEHNLWQTDGLKFAGRDARPPRR